MSRYFEDANVEFMTGAYTQCWQSWRYDNVTPLTTSCITSWTESSI